MRLATAALIAGVVLLVVSFGGGTVMGAGSDGVEEKHKYDIHVDRTAYGSTDGESMAVSDLQPEVQETVTDQINAEPIIQWEYWDTIYTESPSEISGVDYVEYRGLHYQVEVEDHGLVEVTSLSEVFSLWSIGGVWGIILTLWGGIPLAWGRVTGSRLRASDREESA